MEIRFLGVRGTLPVSGKGYEKYGGNTTCILINSGGTSLVIDAGTGISNLRERDNFRENVVFLFTHYHLDHVLGLPFAFLLYSEGYAKKMYGPQFGNFSVENAVDLLSNPKLLPFKVSERILKTRFYKVDKEFQEGNFTIKSLYSPRHPLDGVMLYRIESEDKSVVIATDFEAEESETGVIEFFSGADILIHDAQYTEQEYMQKKGYGHSTEIMAAIMGEKSGVDRLILFHFDPLHRDFEVDRQEERAREVFNKTLAAREGMVLKL